MVLSQLTSMWPISGLKIMSMEKPKEGTKRKVFTETGHYKWYTELVMRHIRLLSYLSIAGTTYTVMNTTIPTLEQVQDTSLPNMATWMGKIIVRDMAWLWLLYGSWHWLLYESKFKENMKHLKYNPSFPDDDQWEHDRFWTCVGSVVTSLYEIGFYLVQGKFGFEHLYLDFWTLPLRSLGLLLFASYWEEFHFYFIHRMMHPWFPKDRKSGRLDPGKFLYRNVHSLHHKSYNTGPWSGLSMHPVEHLLYFSGLLVPSIFGVVTHPIHFLFYKYHSMFNVITAHDGYDEPAGGSFFHYMHHAHFECNYGTPMMPFDKIFGTYEDGKKYQKSKQYHSAEEQKELAGLAGQTKEE